MDTLDEVTQLENGDVILIFRDEDNAPKDLRLSREDAKNLFNNLSTLSISE